MVEEFELANEESLEEYLSHQDSYCESILGETFYAIKGEMSFGQDENNNCS